MVAYTRHLISFPIATTLLLSFSKETLAKEMPYDFSHYSTSMLLERLEMDTNLQRRDSMQLALVQRMNKNDIPELFLGFENAVYTLDGAEISLDKFLLYTDDPVVLNKNSPLFEQIAVQLGSFGDLFRENVEWITLNPKVLFQAGETSSSVRGTFKDNMVNISIDEKQNITAKLLATLVHEAQHAENKKKEQNFSTIFEERTAFAEEYKFLEQYTTIHHDTEGEFLRDVTRRRIMTADYLSMDAFGTDFSNVYPLETILGRELLLASISTGILEKYKKVHTNNPDFDKELMTAVRIALIVKTQSKEEATKTIYPLLQNERLHNMNAYSVLKYLYPTKFNDDVFRGENPVTKTTQIPTLKDLLGKPMTEEKKETDTVVVQEYVAPTPEISIEESLNEKGKEIEEDVIYPYREEEQHIRAYVEKQFRPVIENHDFFFVSGILSTLNSYKASFPGDPDGDGILWRFVENRMMNTGDVINVYQLSSIVVNPEENKVITKEDLYRNGELFTSAWTLEKSYR